MYFGKGVYTWGKTGKVCKGWWLENKMHGYNTCYENGEVVEEGVFLNGKLYTDINHVKKKIKKMKKV